MEFIADDIVEPRNMNKIHLNRGLLLSLLEVLNSAEFKQKFSIDVVPFYISFLHKYSSQPANTVAVILREKVTQKNFPSSLNEGQPSSEIVT